MIKVKNSTLTAVIGHDRLLGPEDRKHPFFERRLKVLTLSPVDETLSKG